MIIIYFERMDQHIHSILDIVSNTLEDGVPAMTIWFQKFAVSKRFRTLKIIIKTAIYSFLIGRLINLYFFQQKDTMEVSILRSLLTTTFNIVFFMYVSSRMYYAVDIKELEKEIKHDEKMKR